MGSDGTDKPGPLGGRRTLIEVRGGGPLREQRIDTYKRLMDAEVLLDDMREDRGLPETLMADVLDSIEGGGPRIEPQEDLYLRTLSRYVAELGGRLEVAAVFPDQTVTLLREPDRQRRGA